MASVQDKAFQIEQFIGMAGDDAAEKIMQRAHDAAGGNDVRRSSPDRYDAAYMSH
ncbi:MAG: hypothetical protein LRY57_01000 [Alphaproteobacteria bacterium]|nr:hypothetical protein [Alphaproteobacteria bacterium]